MDSPRGRLYLMDALVDGTMRLNPTIVEHFDRCLGCMACVTACPSGVKYDRLIEQTRPQLERNGPRSPAERRYRAAIFALYEQFLIRERKPDQCLRAFLNNNYFGMSVFIGIALEYLFNR